MGAVPGRLEMWVDMLTNQEKIKMIEERINNISFHMEGLLQEKDTPYFQSEMYENFSAIINALRSELVALTNRV